MLSQQSTSKNHVTSMSSKLEPAIWSNDTAELVLHVSRPVLSCHTLLSGQLSEFQQAAISHKEIVFRFRKNVQPEKGWGLLSCA